MVVNVGEPVKVWHNLGGGSGTTPSAMGHWIGVKPTQAGTNRDAIGAWVDVEVGGRTIHREVTVGGGHVGGQLLPIHVGIGSATSARVRVTWPDGTVGSWETVQADRVVSIG